jgi:hypothetical protein
MINNLSISSFINNENYYSFKEYLKEEINKTSKSRYIPENMYDPQKLLALTAKEMTLKKVFEELSKYERQ